MSEQKLSQQVSEQPKLPMKVDGVWIINSFFNLPPECRAISSFIECGEFKYLVDSFRFDTDIDIISDFVSLPPLTPRSKTLFTEDFDDRTPYYVFYKKVVVSKLDKLPDLQIIKIFKKLTKFFSINYILHHMVISKAQKCLRDKSNIHEKYVRRYKCNCYNWVCDWCLNKQVEEEKESMKYPINQRYVLSALYEYDKNYETHEYGSIYQNNTMIGLVDKAKELCDKSIKQYYIRKNQLKTNY